MDFVLGHTEEERARSSPWISSWDQELQGSRDVVGQEAAEFQRRRGTRSWSVSSWQIEKSPCTHALLRVFPWFSPEREGKGRGGCPKKPRGCTTTSSGRGTKIPKRIQCGRDVRSSRGESSVASTGYRPVHNLLVLVAEDRRRSAPFERTI